MQPDGHLRLEREAQPPRQRLLRCQRLVCGARLCQRAERSPILRLAEVLERQVQLQLEVLRRRDRPGRARPPR